MKRASLLLLVLAALTTACAADSKRESRSASGGAPADDTAWVHDIVDSSRDLTVNLRPKTLAHDPIYGPLVRKASRIAAGESRSLHLGNTTLEALQQSDEVLLAVRSSRPLDAVLIASGVPSGIDAEKVLDDGGRSPWKATTRTSNGILALSSRESDPPGTLYVVGERTWVFSIGNANDRVRERLAPRDGRAPPRSPLGLSSAAADAPVSIRLQGELLDHLRGFARSGLRPIFDQLRDVRLILGAGSQGNLLATLNYDQDKAAERATGRAEELIAVMPDKVSPKLSFLRSATVRHAGRSVQIAAKLPPDLLRSFADAEKE